jgi:hypothetical protein
VNTICASRESPVGKYLFSITAVPNLPSVYPLVGKNRVGQIPRYSYGSHHQACQSDGLLSVRNSGSTARVMQLSGHLNW